MFPASRECSREGTGRDRAWRCGSTRWQMWGVRGGESSSLATAVYSLRNKTTFITTAKKCSITVAPGVLPPTQQWSRDVVKKTIRQRRGGGVRVIRWRYPLFQQVSQGRKVTYKQWDIRQNEATAQ